MKIPHGRPMPTEETFIKAFGYWKTMNMGNAPTMDTASMRTVAQAWAAQCEDESLDEATAIRASKEITKSQTFYPSWKDFYDLCMKITPRRYEATIYETDPVFMNPETGYLMARITRRVVLDEGMSPELVESITHKQKALDARAKKEKEDNDAISDEQHAENRRRIKAKYPHLLGEWK